MFDLPFAYQHVGSPTKSMNETSVCRDETLKNQPKQTRMTPQYFHTAPTSCAILPSIMHTTKLTTCTLAYSHPLNRWITTHQQGTQHCSLHSLLCTWQPICDMFNSNKSSQHNSDFNMPYKLSNAHGLHSFCIQDRPDLPCSVVIKLQPPTTGLLHAHQHALHTHAIGYLHRLVQCRDGRSKGLLYFPTEGPLLCSSLLHSDRPREVNDRSHEVS